MSATPDAIPATTCVHLLDAHSDPLRFCALTGAGRGMRSEVEASRPRLAPAPVASDPRLGRRGGHGGPTLQKSELQVSSPPPARSHVATFPRSHAAASLVLIGRVDLPASHDITLRWPALPAWPAAATAVLARRLESLEPRPAAVCVWSCELARHLFEALADGRLDVPRVCVDVDHPLERAARLPGLAARGRCDVRWRAADPAVQRWLTARGIDPGRIVLTPTWFAPPAERFALRHQVRRRLGLDPEQQVALVLPPICRASGAFEAVWGAMLAEKVEPRLRLILPGASREAGRIMRLVAACRHAFFVRPADGVSLPELLAAADVGLLCARAPVSQTGLLSAAAGGLPLIATRAADGFGLLEADRTGLVVGRVEPAAIARALVAALREPVTRRAAGRALRQRFERGVAGVTGATEEDP